MCNVKVNQENSPTVDYGTAMATSH